MNYNVRSYEMTIKDLWADTSGWLRSHKIYRACDHRPDIDEEGLMSPGDESVEQYSRQSNSAGRQAA